MAVLLHVASGRYNRKNHEPKSNYFRKGGGVDSHYRKRAPVAAAVALLDRQPGYMQRTNRNIKMLGADASFAFRIPV
jgi:hypothetical protein